MTLGKKLAILFLLFAIFPMSVVGYLSYAQSRRTIEMEMFNHLVATNILKEAEFGRWIGKNRAIIAALSQRPLVREFASILSTVSPSNPLYQSAYHDLLEDHLKIAIEEEGGFLDLSIITGKSGKILISTNKEIEGKYRESAAFYIEGKSRVYVGSVTYELGLDLHVMHISAPIKNKEGNLIAVLAGHMDWNEMSQIMTLHSDGYKSLESYLINKYNFFVTKSRIGFDHILKKAVYTEGVKQCLECRNGVGLYTDYRGIPVIGAYRWISEQALCILTEIDQWEAFGPARDLRNMVLMIAVIVFLITASIALFISRTTSGPIKALSEKVRAFGKGDPDFHIEVNSRDEIGELARTFSHMAEELKEAQTNLLKQEKLAILGQLAGGVGHELRNPLGAIKNAAYFLDIALEKPDQEVKDSIEIINIEVAESEKIIEGLFTFSNPKTPERRAVEVDKIVENVLSRIVVPENIEVIIQNLDAVPSIQADPDQIEQVIGNLIRNSIQAMPDGGRLKISAEAPEEGYLALSLSDTGMGIDKEDLKNVFEPFFTTKAKGIGLGLPYTRILIEAHGGTIDVESPSTELGAGPSTEFGTGKGGKGSTFTVILPVKEAIT